jgi:hypothetical protein
MTPINEALQPARSLGDWGFVLAIIFVAAAVFFIIAEKLSGQQSSKSLWNALKTIAGVLLIGALAIEYSGYKRETRILDSGNADLQKRAEGARPFSEILEATNALLISSNLAMADKVEQLRSANDKLEEPRLPMNIGDRDAFIASLKEGPPTPVFITTGIGDKKGRQTQEQLRAALNSAGWRVCAVYETNEDDPGIVLKSNPGQSEKALHVLLNALLARNIPARITVAENRNLFPVNAIHIFIGERPYPGKAAEMVFNGPRREALHALDAYIAGHKNMTPKELAEANTLAEQVLKLHLKRIAEMAKDPIRGGGTNGINYIELSYEGSVMVSNGIPVQYVSRSFSPRSSVLLTNTIAFTPMTISHWTKMVEETLGTNSN